MFLADTKYIFGFGGSLNSFLVILLLNEVSAFWHEISLRSFDFLLALGCKRNNKSRKYAATTLTDTLPSFCG